MSLFFKILNLSLLQINNSGYRIKIFNQNFTPCSTIGWRLSEKYWNNGYATEGAKACLDHGFKQLEMKEIIAMAPKINIKQEEVMRKIGMKKLKNFTHPLLRADNRLQECVLYSRTNSM